MARSRISIAKPDILAFFDQHDTGIFRQKDLKTILDGQRTGWRLAKSMSFTSFMEYMLANTPLRKAVLRFPWRTETLYTWGSKSTFKIAQSAKPGAYLSHYTAMQLHELTVQIPKTVYVNAEQRPQPKPAQGPTQERVDNAFRRKQRLTKNCTKFRDRRVCLLNGKHTNRLGVIQIRDDTGEELSVTGIERTLIDATVRPAYCGGVHEVLYAFRAARDEVSVNRLMSMLVKLDYAYPYHQAIGVYIEFAGYRESQVALARSLPKELDFYLAHEMAETEYLEGWRLFVPKGFQPVGD